jgi:hypothetical protein
MERTFIQQEIERPAAIEAITRELIRQMEKQLPKERSRKYNCCSEGPGGQKDTCCEDKTVQYFDFGTAIQAVKQGKCVARKGWNGKHQYVELATCISYKGPAGEIVNAYHNSIGNAALAFIGTSGVQLGWLASQADMLAEDWYIVE